MSVLVLVRHGQASFGEANYDRLSPLGVEQAAATGAYFAAQGARFDAVWAGPRQRHADTARAMADAIDHPAPVQTDAALDEFAEGDGVLAAAERHFGVALRGEPALPRREQLQHYDRLIEAWANCEAVIDGRPDVATFRATAAGWLRTLTARPGADQKLLVATSAGTIAALLCELLELPNARLPGFTRVLRNASITELVFSRGRCSLLSFNGVAHLPARLQSSI